MKTPIEDWQNVQYRIDAEGFAYCFDGYSNWEEIQDQEFHRLRKEFLRTMEELRNYVDNKANQE